MYLTVFLLTRIHVYILLLLLCCCKQKQQDVVLARNQGIYCESMVCFNLFYQQVENY